MIEFSLLLEPFHFHIALLDALVTQLLCLSGQVPLGHSIRGTELPHHLEAI